MSHTPTLQEAQGAQTTLLVAPAFWNEARALDDADTLGKFRSQFYLQKGRIYLDGNSLGLLCKPAEQAALRVLHEWQTLGVEGWTDAPIPWFTLAETLSERVGRLVGAEAGAVAVTGSTTVNLHQLLATLFKPEGKRTKILADALNFRSDIFAAESHLRLRGLDPSEHLVLVPSHDGYTLNTHALLEQLTDEIAVAVLPSVLYVSGQLLPMEQITQAARKRNILIGWDCSHSVGAVGHELDGWKADFAFWCHYKYLNAGPGAVGGLYLNRRHWAKAPGMAGWWGSDKQKQFEHGGAFAPAGDAGGLQIGTPPILGIAPLAGALDLHEQAGMANLRAKSLRQTAFLRQVAEAELSSFDFTFATPQKDDERGGHLSLVHSEARTLARALRALNVVPDFRSPNVLRLAPAPLYTTFAECVEAIARLKYICLNNLHRAEYDRKLVP